MSITRVFIANRGEIAVRIVRGCHMLGIETVVGTSEADRDGLAARLADDAVELGPSPANESYLRPELVVDAAIRGGCDAIHPGYGFLSGSPRLAAMARERDLRFVGPPTGVIELGGDPLRARAAASEAGIPVADEERSIASVRYLEVQVAADDHGHIVHLGERDCSVQRRHRKLVEEAPAPFLAAELRETLADAALRYARAIGYRNLGTIEFLVDCATGRHYFLAISCRIQAEHPVTEAVTGRDLISDQLQIAAGRPLGFTQEEVSFDGHAIECRLNAEDVARGFAQTSGTLSLFAVPECSQLRVDTHCFAGAVIPPYYDPLMAKLIASGGDRDEAAEILVQALEDLDVEGVETNRALLVSVLAHRDFRIGAVSTDWLERVLS